MIMENKNSFEDILNKMAPSADEFIERRIKHINFAKTIIWLVAQSKNNEFIYASELAKFFKLTQTRAYVILKDLANAGFLIKKGSSITEFYFKKEGETPIISVYLSKALKVLDASE